MNDAVRAAGEDAGIAYFPDGRRWAVQAGGGDFLLDDRAAVDTLLPLLRLAVRSDPPRRPGRVRLAASADGRDLLLTLQAADGRERRLAVPRDGVPRARAEFLSGRYSDGWIGLDATLEISGMARPRLRLWLPERAESGEKLLLLLVDGATSASHVVRRGEVSFIDLPEALARPVTAQLRAVGAEPMVAGDVRALGFVAAVFDGEAEIVDVRPESAA